MYSQNSSYLNKAFNEPHVLIEAMVKETAGVEYDTMVGTGLSGLLVVPILARALNKHFAIVRKEQDKSHRECDIEGTIGERWIFVDDFISSGATKNRVIKAVEGLRNWRFNPEYVGTYEYHFETFKPVIV